MRRALIIVVGAVLGLAALSFVTTALSSDEEFAPAADSGASTAQASSLALYESARPGDSARRFMSTNAGEFAAFGFADPGAPVAYVFGSGAASGTLEVHRLRNSSTGNRLWTPDFDEANLALRGNRYTYEGVAFRAYGDTGQSRIPVHRLYSPGRDLHHFTTSNAVRDSMLRQGFRSEPTKFYVHPAASTGPLPKPAPPAKPCKAWVFSWCVWR